ncbi:MAG: type I methionyl aminopeptidase [Chloroflexi bacterium]|nr:type I methionyl aminopeptidase [Chloroflexota bacterium]MBU1750897.1 type I methionyl aminopeptidase [Chloroflexota bacterium]
MAVVIKSAHELALMREAGRIVAEVREALRVAVRPGITTAELDALGEQEIRKRGAEPSFKGYRGYPASICVSVNDEIVHGIPGDRVLQAGDIVSLDQGVIYKGYQGDTAITVAVGAISPAAQRLMDVTREALAAAIAAARAGQRLGDVSWAVQRCAEGAGLGVVREYGGHGIGRHLHEDPHIPNIGEPRRGLRLRSGMTLALEPMLAIGTAQTRVLDDVWTVVTRDGGLSAHFEHTIAITDGEAEVLTRL